MERLTRIVTYLDRYLRASYIADYPGAWNGLQIENSGTVTKIGAAVDACEATITEAVDRGITMLLVHHGLFWNGFRPISGATRRKIAIALIGDLAIYSSHLPLDLHPTVGNNVLLCRALGWRNCAPFMRIKGQAIGLQTRVSIPIDKLISRLSRVLGRAPTVCSGGPKVTNRIGVVTGGAGSEVEQAAREGIDTFITGEGPHNSFIAAEELAINVLYGGHYATETFGVRALAALVGKKYALSCEFIDHPTGL